MNLIFHFLIFLYFANRNIYSLNLPKDLGDLSQINLTNLADNSLFTRWRPTFHFASPNSWMNDPCAPLYNPNTQNYHLYYQVQPGYVQWGNISWGHAKSKDMIFWEDVTSWNGYNYVALAPGIGNNQSALGVFTGSGLPISLNGNTTAGAITVIYTSVKYLPISWNGYYKDGSETQSIAISYDDGITYQKYSNNPILLSPPDGWNVTGWRDPKYEKWPELDNVLYGSDQGHYYMTVSSGIRGVGPRLVLYQAPSNNLTNWTYLGPLLAVNGNYTLNEVWSGSLGYNFEVSNAFSLREKSSDGGDNQTMHHFVSLGTEGGNTTLHLSSHWSVWVQGNLTKIGDNNVTMNIISSGVSDWGDAYALNSFYDPVGDRRIFYGWVMEANNFYGERAFGYNGQLTFPREVFIQVYTNVVGINESLIGNSPWIIISNSNGTYTCKTLGVRPIDEITKLRNNNNVNILSTETFNQTTNFTSLNVSSTNFELEVKLNISGNATGGLVFRRSSDGLEYTTLIYDPISEYLILNRTCSSLITAFVLTPIYAKHTLLTTIDNENITQKELLYLRIFVDNSLVEIYANNRTVISTHIYPSQLNSTDIGYFVGGSGDSVTFSDVSLWSNLQNAFPQRPTNSSITLISTSSDSTNSSNNNSTNTNNGGISTVYHFYSLYFFSSIIFLFFSCNI